MKLLCNLWKSKLFKKQLCNLWKSKFLQKYNNRINFFGNKLFSEERNL